MWIYRRYCRHICMSLNLTIQKCLSIEEQVRTLSWDGSFGALLLPGQLGLNLVGELVQVFFHTLHAEPLRVEEAAFRSNTDTHAAQTAAGAQDEELFLVWTEGVFSHKTLFQQHNGSGVGWFLAVVSVWATQTTQLASKCLLTAFNCLFHRLTQVQEKLLPDSHFQISHVISWGFIAT